MYDAIVFDCAPQVAADETQAFICCHCGKIRPLSQWYNLDKKAPTCDCGHRFIHVMCAPTGRDGIVPMSTEDLEAAFGEEV